MSLREFKCTNETCGHTFEIRIPATDDLDVHCQRCNSKATRYFGNSKPPFVHYKGSGFTGAQRGGR